MKIEAIKREHCQKLATLHLKALPDTISSKIGHFYLENIYRAITKDKKNNCAFVALDKREIIGAIAATSNLKLFQSEVLKEFSVKRYLLLLISVLTLKASTLEIFKRIRFEKKLIRNYEKRYATITTLFVNGNFRRRGVGTKLIREILKFYRNRVDNIYVDTLMENESAIKLYESLGFKPQKTIDDSILLTFN